MNQCKLWFLLLLPLGFCVTTEEKTVKIVGSEPDATPICPGAPLRTITLIVCQVETHLTGGGGCRLLYQHGQDFVHQCDPRFKLSARNQSVLLLLTRLTPEDSGNYTCECSHFHGTHFLHLHIQVEGTERLLLLHICPASRFCRFPAASTFSSLFLVFLRVKYILVQGRKSRCLSSAGVAETSRSPVRTLTCTTVISSATGLLIVAGVLLGLRLKKSPRRDQAQSAPSSDRCELGGVYSSLQHSAADLYQTASSMTSMTPQASADGSLSVRKAAVNQDKNGKIHEDRSIYQNVKHCPGQS